MSEITKDQVRRAGENLQTPGSKYRVVALVRDDSLARQFSRFAFRKGAVGVHTVGPGFGDDEKAIVVCAMFRFRKGMLSSLFGGTPRTERMVEVFGKKGGFQHVHAFEMSNE